jgi:serine/threonine protein kinase
MGLPDDPSGADRSLAPTLDDAAGVLAATLAAPPGVTPKAAPRDRATLAGALAGTLAGPRDVKLHVQPGTVLKHYELIRQLGAGGMGMVFLARDIRLGRLVAIKFLLEHTGLAAERFLAEARPPAHCKHENIVVIYDVDDAQGSPYMVLEYIEGCSLREAMTERARDTVAVTASLMLPVARALAHAHAMGIVHRDLKPENILLADGGQVKVVDFGIAKQVTLERMQTLPGELAAPGKLTGLTEDGMLVGTIPYMSPEQWLGEPLDGRSDIWAAGIILFELATGVHPLEPLERADFLRVSQLDIPMPSARDILGAESPLAEVIDRCLEKRKEERVGSAKELVALLEQLGEATKKPAALAEYESPFAGLSAFQETDAARFFGRDDDIAAVLGRLRQQQLVAIAGASGAGKSSFVRAGVIPALKRAGRELSAFVLRPGRRPLAALADVLAFFADTAGDAAEGETDPEAIAKLLRTQPGALGARLRARCRKRGGDHRILLFVDQLEELYTLGIEASERAAFCACLEGVADDASSPLRVIVTIRADFLDRVSEDRRFLSAMTRGLMFLPPMTIDGMRSALQKPLEAARYRLEDEGLCDEMLAELAGMKSPLPLLQFTATKLWDARDREDRLLTRRAYRALGGASGALSTHADAVLAGMSVLEQRLARAIFVRLVTPSLTRAVVRLDELCALSEEASAVEQVVHHLADARLLSIETGGEREGKTVELTHESLIERWVKLKQWLDENEKDAEFLVELRSAASQWEKNGRAEGFLWRDEAASKAGQWLARKKAEGGAEETLGLGKRDRGYLEAVVRLAERSRRRRRQVTGGVIASLALVASVVSLLGVLARSQAKRADVKAAEAQKSAALADKRTAEARNASRMASAREHLSDPTLVLALVREIEPAEQLPPRWRELALWARFQGIASVVLHHQDVVYSAAFSPDGTRIVTASWDKTVRVWNADGTGEPLLLEGHQDHDTQPARP